jgi:hypothetical protein
MNIFCLSVIIRGELTQANYIGEDQLTFIQRIIVVTHWILLLVLPLIYPLEALSNSAGAPVVPMARPLDDQRTCSEDKDCALVPQACSGCECGGLAIAKSHVTEYMSTYQRRCSGYVGSACKMRCPEVKLRCAKDVCILQETRSTDTNSGER